MIGAAGVERVARSGECPAERPPLDGDGGRHARAPRGARRARAADRASPISIPTSRRSSSICSARPASSRGRKARPRSCSRAKAAGRSCRISMRATARPPPRDADRARSRRSSTRAARSSATPACRRPRSSSTRCSTPGDHAVLMRQVYNKTRTYLEWLTRTGSAARVTIVDDGDLRGARAARSGRRRASCSPRRSRTRWCARRISRARRRRRRGASDGAGVKLVIDSTIATPWAFRTPLLAQRRRRRGRRAGPRRSAATIATSGATSPPTTRGSATRSWT